MKKINQTLLAIAISSFAITPLLASKLKVQNMRNDGVGTFVAAEFGGQTWWYAIDAGGAHDIIDSGIKKIRKVMWYDPDNNCFWEVPVDQKGIIIKNDPQGNAGTFKIFTGPNHSYESIANVRATGTPDRILWSAATYNTEAAQGAGKVAETIVEDVEKTVQKVGQDIEKAAEDVGNFFKGIFKKK